MKASQLRELTEEELRQKLSDLSEDLFKLRIRHSVAKLENPMRIREVRKDIARVKTLIREYQLKKREQGGQGSSSEGKR
jgi:large subunit ribosomal protein L29